MSDVARKLHPPSSPTVGRDSGATGPADDSTPPPGWLAPAPESRGRRAYRRPDGAEVFFDRRSRPDDPLDGLSPGWNWLARRPDGALLGRHTTGPTGVAGTAGGTEGGLFLPRKFKTAGEAMRALDREAPVPPAATDAGRDAATLAAALARLEAGGGELLGPGGTLVPRIGIRWEDVRFEAPLLLGRLPSAAGDAAAGKRPRGALVEGREADALGLTVVTVGEEAARALRRLADKLVAAPGAAGARALREFLDFLVVSVAPRARPAAGKPRKRIVLAAPGSGGAAAA